MRLINITTENFKKLGDFTAEFTGGLNIIAGDNARGKSTLLQAVQVAFFGASTIPGKVENVPTWGQKDFKVTLQFEVKGVRYEVVRKKSTAKLTRLDNEELLANGNTPVTAAIEELLGLSSKDYSLFWQSKQGESAGILTFGATALNKKVEEFAGVDLIDKVQNLAQKRHTAAVASAEALEVSQEQLTEAYEAVSEAKAEAVRTLAAVESAKAARVALVQPELKVLPKSADLREQKHEAEVLEQRLVSAEGALERVQGEYDRAAAALDGLAFKETGVLLTQLDGLKEQGMAAGGALKDSVDANRRRDDALSVVKARQQAVVSAENEFDLLNSAAKGPSLASLEDKEAAAKQALSRAAAARDRASSESAVVDRKHADLLAMQDGETCPTCGQATAGHDVDKLAEEVKQAEDEAVACREKADARQWDWEEATRVLIGAQAAKTAANQAAARLRDSAERLGKARQAAQDAEEALILLPGVPADVIAGQEAEVERLRTAYAEKQAELNGVKTSNEAHRKATAAVGDLTTDLQAASALVAKLAAEFDALPEPPTDEDILSAVAAETAQRDVQRAYEIDKADRDANVTLAAQAHRHADENALRAEQALTALSLQADKAKAATASAAKYRRLVQFLRDKRQAYLKDVWTTVLGMSSKLVREASGGEITGVRNDEGEFSFQEAGVWAPVAGSASGAQRALLGVSLRIALARCLYGSESPLIFDEPTESCSERNASAMAATLATCASQVLLITHRENDQALAENVINVGE